MGVSTAMRDVDVVLVVRMAEGDQSALAELYHRYSSLMLAIGHRILGAGREAEDLLHDVFLEVWRRAREYNEKRGTVRTWLTLRMRSRALDRKRSPRMKRSVSLDVGFPAHRSLAGGSDPALEYDRRRVREALAALPKEYQQVLLMGYFEGLSSSEMAEVLGIPIGTVKSRVRSARTQLKAALIPREGATV
jgi:RNA polymerase sigma-70 factor (ECF subfamily)